MRSLYRLRSAIVIFQRIETARECHRLSGEESFHPLMLTDEEALAVMLGLLATRKMSFAVSASAVEGALAKIERVLPVLATWTIRSKIWSFRQDDFSV
jgi:predicted DNA-binding transcriptional regulator YafY